MIWVREGFWAMSGLVLLVLGTFVGVYVVSPPWQWASLGVWLWPVVSSWQVISPHSRPGREGFQPSQNAKPHPTYKPKGHQPIGKKIGSPTPLGQGIIRHIPITPPHQRHRFQRQTRFLQGGINRLGLQTVGQERHQILHKCYV